ncbi:MAG: choice-of-anchor J domain-containing protein, partial [Crocinitomicaceae bacterium]
MRKILPLFLGLIASLSMTAQGVVLEQDFENGLGDWMVADLDSLTYYSGDDTNMAYFENQEEAWIVISREGNKVAASSSYYIDGDNTANDWLISPEFKIGENNVLSWRAKSLGSSSYLEDYMVVMFNMTQDTLVYLEIIVDEPNTWTDHTVSLSEYAGDSAYIVFINAGTDQYIMHLDDIKVQELNSIDVTLDGIDLSEFALAGNIDLSGVFTNNGAETVTSLDIEVSVNGTVSTKNISVNAESFETSSFTLENAMDIVAGSSYDVEVKIISVNGEDDSDNQDNMASGMVTALSEISEKAVLVEEYSGAWCGWCPDGARLLEDLMTNNSNVVGVTVHSGDDMEIADAAGILTENYVAGFPSGSIDRVLFEGEESVATGRYDWDSLSTLRASELTPVSVSGNVEYDADSREVSIKVDAKFFANISGKDYRVNAYILEDSVTGTGEGYDQVNYISGTYTGYFGWTGSEPGYTDESPVVGYVHMKVL